MRRIFVLVSDEAHRCLHDLAGTERRSPREQAAFLLEQILGARAPDDAMRASHACPLCGVRHTAPAAWDPHLGDEGVGGGPGGPV